MNEKIEMPKQSTGWKIDTQREEQKQALENIRDLAECMLRDLENGCKIYEAPSIIAYAQRLEKASQRENADAGIFAEIKTQTKGTR